MICEICKVDINLKGFASHIKKHNISTKNYYDKYLKTDLDGYCLTCGKPTKFKSIKQGYVKHCSNRCAQLDPQVINKKSNTCIEKFGTSNPYQAEEIKQKIKETNKIKYGVESILQIDSIRQKTYQSMSYCTDKIYQTKLNNIRQFELKHNCTLYTTLRKKYGQGWLNLPLERLVLNSHATFIKNTDIPKIIEYVETSRKSIAEADIITFIKTFYDKEISHTNRHIIAPQELDIYLPDIKLAIEYNGTYWHSIKQGTDKNYHLDKSIRCRNMGIRLIHIYEFEDIEKQKQLLRDLILGQDSYFSKDFNKNNLIEDIPKAEIVYKDDRYTIYGAGKLY